MKRILIPSLLLIFAVIGAVLAKLNAGTVAFDYYLSSTEIPLALLLYIVLAIGVILGILVSVIMLLKSKREAKRLRKRLNVCEQELKNLRELPIKGQI
jgi:uncharacterized membrane protein YciS (DUF1049 family)